MHREAKIHFFKDDCKRFAARSKTWQQLVFFIKDDDMAFMQTK